MKKKFESHYLPLLLTLQIRQPNKKNSSSRWNTNSIRNWIPNHKIKTKKKIKKKKKESKRFGLNLQSAVAIASVAKIFETEVVLAFRELLSESFLELRSRSTHESMLLQLFGLRHRSERQQWQVLAMPWHNGGSLQRALLRIRFRWENLFLLRLFFWLNSFFFNTTQLGMAMGRVRAGFFYTRTRPAGQDPWPEPGPLTKWVFFSVPRPALTGPH